MKHRSLLTKAALAASSFAMVGLAVGPVSASQPYNGTVLFDRVIPELRSADPNKSLSSKVIYDGGLTKSVKASPTGGHIAFLRAYDTGNYNLWVMDTDGSNLKNLTADGTINVDSFDWKSTASTLVWSDGDDLFTVGVDGSDVTQITSGAALDTNPYYRPETPTIIVFNRDVAGNKEVFTYSFVTDSGLNLSNNAADDEVTANGNPWGDNQRIAFQSDRSGNFDIYKIYKDGTDLVQLTNSSFDQIDGAYSPNGNYVAYRRNNGAGSYALELETGNGTFERHLDTAGSTKKFAWSPDSDGVAASTPTLKAIDISDASSRVLSQYSAQQGVDWNHYEL